MSISRFKDEPGSIAVRSPQNLAGGLALIGIALLVFWNTQDLASGTAVRMGPGYFPKLLAILIAVCGVVLTATSLFVRGDRLERWAWRPILFILFSIIFFAFAVRPLGLVVTGAFLVVISSIASKEVRWKETGLFAIGLIIFTILLFPIALGLPMPIWPRI
jgi:putative tricarboxylic transport membrane protein